MVDIYELATEVRALSSWCLGRYSIFSLQRLDAICFITVVLANDLDAVIEASKLELLVQLDSKLVDFNVSWSGLGEHAFHLERDGSAEGLASGATEGEHDLVLLVVVSNHMLSHGKRDRDCGGGLALDFLFDRDAEDVNGHLVTWLLISKSESAASLPRPVGIVENFELDDLGHARSNLENLLRLAGADGAGLFPAILVPFVSAVLHLLLEFLWVVLGPFAPLTHLVSAPLHLVLELFWVVFGPFAPLSHLFLELLHHVLEAWTTWATWTAMATASTAATTTSSATSSTSAAAEASHHLLDELHRVLGRVLGLLVGSCRGIFIKHSDHDIGSSTILSDLEESVLMAKSFFAASTVVEVLADRALVAKTLDWGNTTAVASHVGVDNLSLISGLLNRREVLRLKELLKDFLGLLIQLIVYEVLKCLSWDALDLILFGAFLRTSWGGLATIIFHLLIVSRDCCSSANLGLSDAGGLDGEDELRCR